MLQEAIEESTPLAKPSNRARDFWNQSCSEVVMESRRLRTIWKTQGTLGAWNEYLKHNDHKNKIIRQTKRAHFRTQMHELSEAPKSIWRFAKWARTESQLPKKLPQFPSLKRSDTDHMATTFEEKTEILRGKFFPPPPQADVSDIAGSFIPLAVSSNPRITEDEVKQAIRRVKADKAPGASCISNRALQAGLAELTPVLTSLFNACVTHKYHPKQFKKAQTIVLRKPKKSDYTDPKAYRPIALLDTMGKALESIMAKRLSDIAETHRMLPNAQMGARRKRSVISALDLLIDQVHTVWGCGTKYVASMLSLDAAGAFDRVSHVRLLHTLKMKRTPSYIIEWTRSFLEDRETSLIFDGQTSDMREVNAGIPQGSPISPILFLFFNASLIEKCEALGIKIGVLGFVDDINILAYGRSTEETCRTLSKAHDACAEWARTHGATFAPEKYELTHFTRKPKRFDMTASIQIESSVIKPKPDVRVLGVQLDTKLRWGAHLRQIEANHATRMLALSRLGASTWGATFTKARQVYSAVVRSGIAFGASVWHQRGKKSELSGKERRLGTLQNQALRHVAGAFKRVNTETLEAETYTSPLHVHLNMLQDKATLHSRVDGRTQEARQACELIRARLTGVNRVIPRSPATKKIVLLNAFIREGAKIQSRRRRRTPSFTTVSTSDSIAITQYHKDQWNQRWEKYRERVADVNATPAQRSHLSNKTVKMRDGLQKAESTLATHIRTERIGLNAYLHSRNVPGTDSPRCGCGWSHQTAKHVLMHCPDWSHLRSRMLQDAGSSDYRIIVATTKGLRAVAKMMMETELLEQFRVARTLVL